MPTAAGSGHPDENVFTPPEKWRDGVHPRSGGPSRSTAEPDPGAVASVRERLARFDAPAELLPRPLREPPWTAGRKGRRPIVLSGLKPPDLRELVWAPGERAAWAARVDGTFWVRQHIPDGVLAARELAAGEIPGHRMPAVLLKAPEELVRPLLATLPAKDTWGGQWWAKAVLARFGLDAVPFVLRMAAANPATRGDLLLPVVSAEVAELMAGWLARLKTARAAAATWFGRHPAAAARLLVPAALANPGTPRRTAAAALRFLAAQAHGDEVRAAAAEHGRKASAAVDVLLDADPLDVLPVRLPAMGDWTDPRLLPPIRLRDRTETLPDDAVVHVLTMLALSRPSEPYPGIAIVRETCDPASLAGFALALFRLWRANGSPPKDGWALTALGLFGDDGTARALAPLIHAWPGEGGHARAVAGLDTLAAIGTDVALARLSDIAQKARFPALRQRAQERIAQVAAGRGLSADQLADRLVPDLGVGTAGTLTLDYGSRRFVVGFDERLRPYVADDSGRRRASLPRPGAKDDPVRAAAELERFAALKKEARAVAGDQVARLEQAMVRQRTWTAREFRRLFVCHPLLWHIGRRLVWTAGGTAFRLAEDRTFADVADDTYPLPSGADVAVAHPVLLGDTLGRWASLFADYEILQPFPQLGRPVHTLSAEESANSRLTRFESIAVPVGRLLALPKHGWRRGEPQDAGMEGWISRPVPDGGAVVVELDPGIAAGMVAEFPEQKLTAVRLGGADPNVRPPGDRTFGDLDPVTASELLAELTALTD